MEDTLFKIYIISMISLIDINAITQQNNGTGTTTRLKVELALDQEVRLKILNYDVRAICSSLFIARSR